MKIDLFQVGFVILLVTILFWVLNALFFKPVLGIMSRREALLKAGEAATAEAEALAASRQGEYDARLRALREKAFQHRSALASAASRERQSLLEQARSEAAGERTEALARLAAQREAAKADLIRQVDAIADSMAAHLLKAVRP